MWCQLRPKKVILLHSNRADDIPLMRFVLETHGYRVFTAESAQEEIQRSQLVVVVCPKPQPSEQLDNSVAIQLIEMAGYLPLYPPVLLLAPCDSPLTYGASRVISPNATAAEILYNVKLLFARKRGPKTAVNPDQAVAA